MCRSRGGDFSNSEKTIIKIVDKYFEKDDGLRDKFLKEAKAKRIEDFNQLVVRSSGRVDRDKMDITVRSQ